MELTKKQQEGLELAVKRYKEKAPYTCIAGYAGTGKSTLIKFIVSALNINPNEIAYIAYTGKAALVLKNKGCQNAMTAHRLLYQSYPKGDGTFSHRPRRPIYPYKLIVVDEISMLPDEIWQLLLSHNIHVIALGDPFQLPPVGKDNGVLAKPHIFLDEIMRQEEESEIIKLTMDLRAGKPLQLFKGKEVQVISKEEIVTGMYTWADQIIVGKNDTRHQINYDCRNLFHNIDGDAPPINGDKVICDRNYWETMNEGGDILVNGSMGYLENVQFKEGNYYLKPQMIANFIPDQYNEEDLSMSPQDLIFRDLNVDYKLFTEHEPLVNETNWKKIPKIWKPKEFEYGYAITCHKSQGSEYKKVLVLEEWLKGGAEMHARWLYTAATRASEKLIIVKDYK